jgi:hypothetical protein
MHAMISFYGARAKVTFDRVRKKRKDKKKKRIVNEE